MTFFSSRHASPKKLSTRNRWSSRLAVERLEKRIVPSTFTVQNLQDSGAGSLRQAILSADANPGADVINFSVAGTIQLTSGALPAITGQVNINGTTAPGFAGVPAVVIDFHSFGGLQFNAGATGSDLRSLALDNASAAGVTLTGAGSILIVGNYIGLGLNGSTLAANGGDGLDLSNSSGDTIGGNTPETRNVISGNQGNGISISESNSNRVYGNYIGTDATGANGRGNTGAGILVTASASGNVIGGLPGNVISANNGDGVLLNGGSTMTTVKGNLIGLTVSGNTPLGNRLDGVQVQNSTRNIIGNSNPVTGITYYNADNVGMQPVSGWQGIRGGDANGQYLMVGTSNSNGLLFEGTMAGVGTSYAVNYPNAYNTSVYGPNNLGDGNLQLVGSYKNYNYSTAPVVVNGFIFQGTTADLSDAGDYQTIDHPGAEFTYVHSTMGGLVVGNYDSETEHGEGSLAFGPGHAFIYDIATKTFVTDIAFPGSLSNTAYGIWYNGGTSYTICGGYSLDAVNNFQNQDNPIGQGYLVDYNSATGQFSNWASFSYPKGTNYVTHFEGVSSVENGVYTLSAVSVETGTTTPVQGSLVTVRRSTNGSFGAATWTNLSYPGVSGATTTSNCVYGNQVVGIVTSGGTIVTSYQATVNVGFQLSNVISANGNNGVNLNGANGNVVAMNYIGINSAGTVALGNAQNGILITADSTNNMIGGEATGGNDPTNSVFARPPEGNLISGNSANGVLINGGATQNILAGNFIGTSASGDSALGNGLDGVDIQDANGNALIGCTFQQDPFVFYNVLSGNGGNGLQVTDSNNTTIQANFFGMGANNNTAVGNLLNGVVIDGSSSGTVMGGPIPLGNVDSANGQNGLVVAGTASNLVTYNTFCGLAAFSDSLKFGNAADGMLITSTGANILIRTCVITCNGDDGIEIGGAAAGVRVAGNIVGLNSQGTLPMGNLGNGIEVDGAAHNIVIGGPQPTFNLIPHNAISANDGNGVAIDGNAYNVTVDYSFIGTDLRGTAALGNDKAGVFVGSGTSSTSIGSTNPSLLTVISGNLGDGVELRGTTGNTVVGCLIGTNAQGATPLPNLGDGVYLSNSSHNTIGNPSSGGPANLIAFNSGNGVNVASGNSNGIRENSIFGNDLAGINLGPWANLNQTAPQLLSVQSSLLGAQITGTLTSTPLTNFTIEFFASSTSGPSGRYLLGSTKEKTNAAGFVSFTYNGPALPAGATFVTATASDPLNDTSEFSASVS